MTSSAPPLAADVGPQPPPTHPAVPQRLWPPALRRWVMLNLGFGTGLHFLATWQAWRQDPKASEKLVFVATEAQPPSSALLRQLHAGTALQPLAETLAKAWPPLTPNVHLIELEGGRVRLLLALGPTRRLLRQLRMQADAIHLDLTGALGPVDEWHPRQFKTLARLAAADAQLSVAGTAPELGAGLAAAGFVLEQPSADADHACDILRARYAPHFTPRRAVALVRPRPNAGIWTDGGPPRFFVPLRVDKRGRKYRIRPRCTWARCPSVPSVRPRFAEPAPALGWIASAPSSTRPCGVAERRRKAPQGPGLPKVGRG